MRVLPDTAAVPAQCAVGADVHVVTDLHQVVQFHPVFDHGVVQRTPIDACVGADLDIVTNAHASKLLDLLPAALVRCKAESISANHDAAVYDATRANVASCANHHLSRQPGLSAH
jgi:hypothetical protein